MNLHRAFALRAVGKEEEEEEEKWSFALLWKVREERERERERERAGHVGGIEVAVRGVQVLAAEVHARLRVRALLPAGPADEVHQRASGVRSEQRGEAAWRAQPVAEGGRRELAGLRGGGAAPRPRLWLRRSHLPPPTQAPPGAERPLQRQEGALRLPQRSHRRSPPPTTPSGISIIPPADLVARAATADGRGAADCSQPRARESAGDLKIQYRVSDGWWRYHGCHHGTAGVAPPSAFRGSVLSATTT
ncbi:unnamed protein product [Musa hybrid cultivar]